MLPERGGAAVRPEPIFGVKGRAPTARAHGGAGADSRRTRVRATLSAGAARTGPSLCVAPIRQVSHFLDWRIPFLESRNPSESGGQEFSVPPESQPRHNPASRQYLNILHKLLTFLILMCPSYISSLTIKNPTVDPPFRPPEGAQLKRPLRDPSAEPGVVWPLLPLSPRVAKPSRGSRQSSGLHSSTSLLNRSRLIH
jgi:hypothetical protein